MTIFLLFRPTKTSHKYIKGRNKKKKNKGEYKKFDRAIKHNYSTVKRS